MVPAVHLLEEPSFEVGGLSDRRRDVEPRSELTERVNCSPAAERQNAVRPERPSRSSHREVPYQAEAAMGRDGRPALRPAETSGISAPTYRSQGPWRGPLLQEIPAQTSADTVSWTTSGDQRRGAQTDIPPGEAVEIVDGGRSGHPADLRYSGLPMSIGANTVRTVGHLGT